MNSSRFLVISVLASAAVLLSFDGRSALAAPPSNDDLASAAQVIGPGGVLLIDTSEATLQLSEPVPSCVAAHGNSIWFRYPAFESVTVTADTYLSTTDTVLAVYSGPFASPTFASLVPVACNNNAGFTAPAQAVDDARVTFAMTAGLTYYFQVSQVTEVLGSAGLRLGVLPTNDNFAGATPITTPQVPGIVASLETSMATIESGENNPAALQGEFGQPCTDVGPVASVWYEWTSPNASGHAVFDTYGSSYDTVLAIYTGSGYPLTDEWCNDGWTHINPSLGLVSYSSATTYYIQVTAYPILPPPATSNFIVTGGDLVLNMSLGSTLFVHDDAEGNNADSTLTLREAMLLSQGTLGRAPEQFEDFLNYTYGISAGAGSGELIHVYFTCSGCTPPIEIDLSSPLPDLAAGGDAITVKRGNPTVDGQNGNFNCFNVSGDSNRIEGLAITRCAGPGFPRGIQVTGSDNIIGGSTIDSQRNYVSGNGIGILLAPPGTGNKVIGNTIGQSWNTNYADNSNGVGITVSGSSNTIGGSASGEGNHIAKNTSTGVRLAGTDNSVKGNYIGTDWTGQNALANAAGVELLGPGNFIGGSAPGEGNVISGNTFRGIYASSATGNTIQGNLIGTDYTGTMAVPNGLDGIALENSPGNLIGGNTPGTRNVISGNGAAGILISGDGPSGPAAPINPFGFASSQLTVPNGSPITDVNVTINITHPQTADLSISLMSPQGTTIDLSSNNGFGPNYTDTTFDDEAATSITDGSPPFTGSFRPEVPLSNFDGQQPGGTWTLQIMNSGFDSGILNSWSLEISPGSPNIIQGNYIGADAAGTGALPNAQGVKITGAGGTLIGGAAAGEGNTIAFNTGVGVQVSGTTATGNPIRGNSIHTNGGLGIDNVSGGNGEPGHAPPVIFGLGSAAGTACAGCTVDVYSDSADEGQIYHGSALADSSGRWFFAGAVAGPNVTATATNASGSTSEFSIPCSDGDADLMCNSGDPCPAVADCDGDGWMDGSEANFIGTDPLDACRDDPSDNAWPADINNDGFSDITDITFLTGAFGAAVPPAPPRFDVAEPPDGFVDISDITRLTALFGQGCGPG